MYRGSRRSRRQDLPIRAEINVTSLVDVAFTLLVIFIITAPMLQGGVEVDVPEADVSPLTSDTEPIIVSIDRAGRIFLAETEIPFEDMRTSLPQLLRAADSRTVSIKGDSLAAYGRVLEVVAVVSQVPGLTVQFVGNPRPAERRR